MSRLTKQNRNRNSVQSSESTQLTADVDPLSPPRPFFLAGDSRRNSGSESSISDSDREQTSPRVQQTRRRSAMASSSTGPYAPVAPASPVSPNFTRRRNSNGAARPVVPFETVETGYSYQQDRDAYAPVPGAGAEDHELSPTSPSWSPNNLYDENDSASGSRGRASSRTRPPPSSFQFPFQGTFLFGLSISTVLTF